MLKIDTPQAPGTGGLALPTAPLAQAGSPADAFANQAKAFIGQPYQWGGGHGGRTGVQPVDCSGLVTQAARMSGLNIEGTADGLSKQGQAVGLNELRQGDLVFKGKPAYHVGIYMGDGQVLHAPRTGKNVEMTGMAGWGYARRVAPGGAVTNGAPVAQAPANLPQLAPRPRMFGDAAAMLGGQQPTRLPLPQPTPAQALPSALAPQRQAAFQPQAQPQLQGGQAGGFEKLLGLLKRAGVDLQDLEALAAKHDVPLRLALAVIQQESGGDPNAVSHAGARGLMQLMPATARGLGVADSFDPQQNLEGGFKLLGQLLDRYQGDTSLALAAYNAGPGAVKKFGGVPPYKETQNYVAKVEQMAA